MNDGACWQAQCALAYIRANVESILEASWYDEMRSYLAQIDIGRFENCREQGYIFSIRNYPNYDKQGNWVVYEHRNVDHAMVFFFNGKTINTPTLDEVCDKMDNGAYCTKKDFGYDIPKMLEWLKKDMTEWVEDAYAV